MTSLLQSVATAVDAIGGVSREVSAHRALPDTQLLELARLLAEGQRLWEAHAALVAGEIDRRSAPVLGSQGLAQRLGARTPVELVRLSTGSTGRDAAASVRAGRLVIETTTSPDPITGEVPTVPRPWLEPIGRALGTGLSVAAAGAIESGLGTPSAGVDAAALAHAAAQLCSEASTLDADRLYRRARQLRDELDLGGIAEREQARRQQRALRFRTLPDGMARLTWDLDPESAAHVGDLYDRATSPRRGGPRFVDEGAKTLSQRILDDERTTEQLASDVFVGLLRAGSDADSSGLLGSGAPVVTILVKADALERREGSGRIQGHGDAVSIGTVERIACNGVVVPIVLDGDEVLKLGRGQRLFSPRQRAALAARDGGCRMPGCDRPPSWTEAHHIEEWERDRGPTDVSNGVLLCRHHHLLVHNNGWDIHWHASSLRLIPPVEVDPMRTPIDMPSKR